MARAKTDTTVDETIQPGDTPVAGEVTETVVTPAMDEIHPSMVSGGAMLKLEETPVEEKPVVLTPAQKMAQGLDLDEGDLSLLLSQGDKKTYTKYMHAKAPKVRFFIPLDGNEKIQVDKVTGQKLYPMEYVSISEVEYRIPKGIFVDIPEPVADVLQEYLRVPTEVQVVAMQGAIQPYN